MRRRVLESKPSKDTAAQIVVGCCGLPQKTAHSDERLSLGSIATGCVCMVYSSGSPEARRPYLASTALEAAGELASLGKPGGTKPGCPRVSHR